MSLTSAPVGTYTTTGSIILPGFGTVVGGVIDVLNQILGGASQKDVANNQFIDNLVYSATQLGFSGFSHEDVVHLMPGGWGNNYGGATSQFQAYLNKANDHPLGTNLAPYFSWGGGYYPNHEITYHPPQSTTGSGQPVGNVTPGTGSVGSIGTGVNNPNSTNKEAGFAGMSTIGLILLAGIAVYIVIQLARSIR